jgi:hypothetical protein
MLLNFCILSKGAYGWGNVLVIIAELIDRGRFNLTVDDLGTWSELYFKTFI